MPTYPGHTYAQQLPPQITVSPHINVVASPSMSQSITIERRRRRHGFHLIMTLLTGGLWGLCVWLPIAILRRGH